MDYTKLPKYYTLLVAAVDDAIQCLERLDIGQAKEFLVNGLQEAEEKCLDEME